MRTLSSLKSWQNWTDDEVDVVLVEVEDAGGLLDVSNCKRLNRISSSLQKSRKAACQISFQKSTSTSTFVLWQWALTFWKLRSFIMKNNKYFFFNGLRLVYTGNIFWQYCWAMQFRSAILLSKIAEAFALK